MKKRELTRATHFQCLHFVTAEMAKKVKEKVAQFQVQFATSDIFIKLTSNDHLKSLYFTHESEIDVSDSNRNVNRGAL